MIKQVFYFDGKEFIRFYHDGFNDYRKNRNLSENTVIDSHNIEFKEYYIDDLINEDIECDDIIEGFLSRNNKKNPYSSCCCNYKEYINYNKELYNEFQDKDIFKKVSDFVEEWSGFKLKYNPYSIFNIFVFNRTLIDINLTTNDEGNIFIDYNQNIYNNILFIIKLKLGNIIVNTMVYRGSIKNIIPNQLWDSIDIEIYSEDNKLIYAYYDLHFIKYININMGIINKDIEMNLKTQKRKVNLKSVFNQLLKVGKKNSDSDRLISYLYNEQLAYKKKNYNNRLFEFLGKNEEDKAFKIFEQISSADGFTEMWIFDPYFIDYKPKGGKDKLNDIIIILSKNLSLKKNIVYEVGKNINLEEKNENSIDKNKVHQEFDEFIKAIKPTKEIINKKAKQNLNITFYGTKEHFHDRFIFLTNDDFIKGYMLGTSLNSFGDNYSTIIELDLDNAKIVFNKLKNNVVNKDNIMVKEDF
ncbi:VPA1262 family N-terminal domain-containing protein [Thermoanaerobacterium sp. RBIITD]|uniref:VPA1262 family N-terminal domain-containing protein n=1 Tax=Thermoanaerobacterium sp. RBIITD TaxID=1550240 RepID=UPI000BB77342|nr:VPA1262 family N-terminal domain-containing protein [Thermoanaerobacterium sp. RBIITD]SNX52903.1 hypothetical protein SAMN05660242_0367 [Thermoanaerobacterium sp. RBIITD]